MTAEKRTERLRRLERLFMRSPIYFVTACTEDRRKILASAAVHETFLRERPSAWGMDWRVCDYARSLASVRRNGCRKNHVSSLDEVFEEYDLKNPAIKRSCLATLAENIFRSLAAKQRILLRKMELRS